jgi:16S rRNA processing protein RimM
VEQNKLLVIGKIIGVHGLKGTVKVYSYAESLSVFKPGSLAIIKNREKHENFLEVQWVKSHTRATILLSFKGINDRNTAETLVDSELFITKKELPELEDGTYYWSDLIGLCVYTIDRKFVGCIESIIPTGSNDVYVVKNNDNEILIPAIGSVVKKIDIKQKKMEVELPEGL